MFLRYNYWWEDQAGAGVSGGNTAWGWLPSHYTAITPSGVYAITRVISPTTVLQATGMGFQRFTEAGPALNQAVLDARNRVKTGVDIPQFNPSMNPQDLVPQSSFGGINKAPNPGYATRFPLRGAENTFNWNGTLSKVIGSHSAKTGIYAERWRVMKGEQANFAGTLAFGTDSVNPLDTGNAYSNAIIGTLASYTESNARASHVRIHNRCRVVRRGLLRRSGRHLHSRSMASVSAGDSPGTACRIMVSHVPCPRSGPRSRP